jgi:hypothetical protein
MTDRRAFLAQSVAALGGVMVTFAGARALGAQGSAAQPTLPPMTVYKTPSCGCCRLWVDHAKANGFPVRVVDTNDLGGVTRDLGVPAQLASCHTVVVGGFLVEGHVPAADVKRLLATTPRPRVRGLAVPGMPIGAPGMEQGAPADYDRYDVIAFATDGTMSVFATHGPPTRR